MSDVLIGTVKVALLGLLLSSSGKVIDWKYVNRTFSCSH